MDTIKKDALGQPVLFGKIYGYSLDSSGIMRVVVGKALKATKQGVTLEVISSKRALYSHDFEPDTDYAAKVNVKSGKLFPVKI